MRFVVVKKKSIQYFLIVALALILLSINVTGGTLATVYFGYAPRRVPVYSVDTKEKQVAISFDSAWGADKTLKILETLKEFNAGATFFLVGFWVDKYPEMVQAIKEHGIEIGTHSNTHPDMAKLSASQIKLELETSVKLIEDITKDKVTLFRAPFGSYNDTLIKTAEELNLTTIQWDIDTLDWKGLSAMEITNRVINNVKNGSIILCHNNADHITEALPLILDRLQKQGYTITSIGDLIMKDNYYVDNLGVQRKSN